MALNHLAEVVDAVICPVSVRVEFPTGGGGYKKEERKGMEGQTTMHTSIAADYVRRSVSVRVK